MTIQPPTHPLAEFLDDGDLDQETVVRLLVRAGKSNEAANRFVAACHPLTPSDTVRRLAEDPNPAVRRGVVGRPTVETEIDADQYRALLADAAPTVAASTATWTSRPETLAVLIDASDRGTPEGQWVATEALRNAACPEDLRIREALGRNPYFRHVLAATPQLLTGNLLATLGEIVAREIVAIYPEAPRRWQELVPAKGRSTPTSRGSRGWLVDTLEGWDENAKPRLARYLGSRTRLGVALSENVAVVLQSATYPEPLRQRLLDSGEPWLMAMAITRSESLTDAQVAAFPIAAEPAVSVLLASSTRTPVGLLERLSKHNSTLAEAVSRTITTATLDGAGKATPFVPLRPEMGQRRRRAAGDLVHNPSALSRSWSGSRGIVSASSAAIAKAVELRAVIEVGVDRRSIDGTYRSTLSWVEDPMLSGKARGRIYADSKVPVYSNGSNVFTRSDSESSGILMRADDVDPALLASTWNRFRDKLLAQSHRSALMERSGVSQERFNALNDGLKRRGLTNGLSARAESDDDELRVALFLDASPEDLAFLVSMLEQLLARTSLDDSAS